MGMLDFPYCLPNELMEEFGAFTGRHWNGLEMERRICDAIRAYMKPQPAAPARSDAMSDAGAGKTARPARHGRRGQNRQAQRRRKTPQAQQAAQAT